jgi:hypothetical protein
MNSQLPKTDLRRLQSEVLSKGAEAALPCNLSDYWLDLIGRDLECLGQAVDLEDPNASGYMSVPLALVGHILVGKAGDNEATVPVDDMYSPQCSEITSTKISPHRYEPVS